MIIPKRDAKSYGAVHIDHYLTFTGFCKKVSSDEIQNIDVLIDGNKIDTIVCDKTIDKVSQIYDIEGHGFEYDLPETYFDKRHLLSFRCSDSGEELVNSPISTICKDDEKFNEYKFMHSLSKPINEEKIKDMYCPNSIGFLAVEENLNDTKFIEYLKVLCNKLPHVVLKVFYLNEQQYNLCRQIFINDMRIFFIQVKTINDITQNVEIYFKGATKDSKDNQVFLSLISNSSEVACIPYYYNSKQVLKNRTSKIGKIELNNISFNNHKIQVDLNTYSYEFDFYTIPELILSNKEFKNNFILCVYQYIKSSQRNG